MKNTTTPNAGTRNNAGFVIQNPDGSFSIIGDLANRVESCAAARGMSVEEYTEMSVRELVSKPE